MKCGRVSAIIPNDTDLRELNPDKFQIHPRSISNTNPSMCGQRLEPWELSSAGKIVVLGIGNRYVHDDAAGIELVEELRKLNLGDDVLLFDYSSLDLELLSYFKGSSRIVIVDALKAGGVPGTVSKYRISNSTDPMSQLPNIHEMQIHEVVDLARQSGVLSCPVIIIGIEPRDCTPGEGLSVEVRCALPNAISDVLVELNKTGE